jgi:hypothetical protein
VEKKETVGERKDEERMKREEEKNVFFYHCVVQTAARDMKQMNTRIETCSSSTSEFRS